VGRVHIKKCLIAEDYMADNNIIIIETDPEQMIAKNGCRNIKQFDIQTGCDNLIASLWQDGKENWYWTKRLYDSGDTQNMDISKLNDKTINGIIRSFVEQVITWLDNEASYLLSLKNSLDSME